MMKKTISSCSRYMSDSGRRDAMIIVFTVVWKPSGKARCVSLGCHIFQRTP